jgi:hydroxypyruvate reductase
MLSCEAKNGGTYLADAMKAYIGKGENVALIAGGETVVKLTGKGKGGRNQELALAAAPLLADEPGCALFSVGSDGTDGPTDAAGGYVDYDTEGTLKALGISVAKVLRDNDAYHALQCCDGLIITGPTGTNMNDVSVCLYRAK